ncbi:structural maintenance of chromosomes protein 2-like isoform X1 [Galleria mellonella]|uniref:Structural maintenance of chromosomes protein 2-like isoform X1 n=1 Tax=Galleria mellonella TaxID=7137 RepID=A0A6J1W8G9_GALME|nr:structural maintenance of chromosomes protein 2-like isoform X1 [Galleria mellonella]
MFSPEEQQIEICLLKSNLEKIEDDIVVQNSALPELDAENEQKYRDTMTALRIARSLNSESERLNQKNVKLTARRMQLKRQCDDITTALETARGKRSDLVDLLKREEQEMELQICNYEDSLRAMANRFRTTSNYYNEIETKNKMNEVEDEITELENEIKNRQLVAEELRNQLESLRSDVPENILEIIGKTELEEKLNNVMKKLETLTVQRTRLHNSLETGCHES